MLTQGNRPTRPVDGELRGMAITVVLGASENPQRYAHMAVRRLVEHGHDVLAVGRRAGRIGDVPIRTDLPDHVAVDTVTVYLSPSNQESWRSALIALRPRRVIFNPGAENPSLALELRSHGVRTEEACTLVLLSTGAY